MDFGGIEAIKNIPVLGQLAQLLQEGAAGMGETDSSNPSDFFEAFVKKLQGIGGTEAVTADTNATGAAATAAAAKSDDTPEKVEARKAFHKNEVSADRVSEAAALIGSSVSYMDPKSGVACKGTVSGLDVRAGEFGDYGEYRVMVDGQSIPRSSLICDTAKAKVKATEELDALTAATSEMKASKLKLRPVSERAA